MTLRTALVVVVVVTAVALPAGCGGSGDPPGGASAASTPDAASALRAVARCYRANGYPSFPDPEQDEDGNWNFPESAASGVRMPPTCRALAMQAKAQMAQSDPKGKPASAADMAKLRAFARCMREHGLADWPDPDEDGAFPLPSRLQNPQGAPLTRPREAACKQYLPSRGFVVSTPGSGSQSGVGGQ
jgi:hypothetical protein